LRSVEKVGWLKDDERAFLIARLKEEQGDSAAERRISAKDVVQVISDSKVWLGSLMSLGVIVPAYSYAYFSPTIIATYDYDTITTQLISVPPWVCAFAWSMVVAWVSDRLRMRFIFAAGSMVITLISLSLLMEIHDNHHAEYGLLFLFALGIYTAMPTVLCWYNMNLSGHHRRSIGSAFGISFGNIGGIVSTYAFVSSEAPYYRTGFIICLSFVCLALVSAALYVIVLFWENRRRDNSAVDARLTEAEKRELGVSDETRAFESCVKHSSALH
jgi:predicted MFS family arabinose efflux permease